jgi:hypothetical protein
MSGRSAKPDSEVYELVCRALKDPASASDSLEVLNSRFGSPSVRTALRQWASAPQADEVSSGNLIGVLARK